MDISNNRSIYAPLDIRTNRNICNIKYFIIIDMDYITIINKRLEEIDEYFTKVFSLSKDYEEKSLLIGVKIVVRSQIKRSFMAYIEEQNKWYKNMQSTAKGERFGNEGYIYALDLAINKNDQAISYIKEL